MRFVVCTTYLLTQLKQTESIKFVAEMERISRSQHTTVILIMKENQKNIKMGVEPLNSGKTNRIVALVKLE